MNHLPKSQPMRMRIAQIQRRFGKKKQGPYHYVTVPDGETYHDKHHAPAHGDAYTALLRFSQLATDKTQSIEIRRRALHFIVHIIGDLHQPLHVGNGTDRGGNDVKLEFFWGNV